MKNVDDSGDPVVGSKRKREEEEATDRWGQLLTAMMEHSQNQLKQGTQSLTSNDTIPSSLGVSLNFDSTPGAPLVPNTQLA
ncbi:hypothetical protein A2U01_0073353, partial [Trifolium medium]|nr:hypothetical protein [Trifolium medium]